MMQPARLRLAIRLWHRFANTNVESFDDETHKAEYLDAVDDLSSCLLLRLLVSRAFLGLGVMSGVRAIFGVNPVNTSSISPLGRR